MAVNSNWVKGSELEQADRKHTVEKIVSSFYYCRFCFNEAYWDTDYGQQLFAYCPYCGKKMKNRGKKNE